MNDMDMQAKKKVLEELIREMENMESGKLGGNKSIELTMKTGDDIEEGNAMKEYQEEKKEGEIPKIAEIIAEKKGISPIEEDIHEKTETPEIENLEKESGIEYMSPRMIALLRKKK